MHGQRRPRRLPEITPSADATVLDRDEDYLLVWFTGRWTIVNSAGRAVGVLRTSSLPRRRSEPRIVLPGAPTAAAS